MTGMGEVSAVFASASAAIELLKAAKGIKDNFEYEQQLIDIQSKLGSIMAEHLALQKQHSSAISENNDLREEVAKMVKWSDKAANYRLKDFGSGTFAYVEKHPQDNDDDPHCLCACCYRDGKEAILQFKFENVLKQRVFHCPNCQNDFPLGSPQKGGYHSSNKQSGGFNPHDFA